jgi:hypothetical protein
MRRQAVGEFGATQNSRTQEIAQGVVSGAVADCAQMQVIGVSVFVANMLRSAVLPRGTSLSCVAGD